MNWNMWLVCLLSCFMVASYRPADKAEMHTLESPPWGSYVWGKTYCLTLSKRNKWGRWIETALHLALTSDFTPWSCFALLRWKASGWDSSAHSTMFTWGGESLSHRLVWLMMAVFLMPWNEIQWQAGQKNEVNMKVPQDFLRLLKREWLCLCGLVPKTFITTWRKGEWFTLMILGSQPSWAL